MEHAHHDAAEPAARRNRHEGHSVRDFARRFWVSLALTVPVLLLSPGLPGVAHRLVAFPGVDTVLLGLSTLLYLYGGWPFLKGLVAELRARTPGMMTLVAVAISVAHVYSAATVFGLSGMPLFWETATLVDVMLLGHWIEMRSVGQASRAVESLARLVPSAAHVLRNGPETDVPTAELVAGDIVLVKPGEKVPADGVVTDGSSSVDESLLTGESVPVSRAAGERVIGGSLNGRGALTVRVDRVGSESFLAQVAELVRDAQASKSRTQDLADRAAMWLTVLALGGGTATFAGWLVAGRPLAYAIERAVSVMVTACPHALGLAIPLVIAVSTTRAARQGLFIRNRTAFENARSLGVVIFDKTGTLTEGHFGVSDVLPAKGFEASGVLRLAAAVEKSSEHPIARAIVEAATGSGLPHATDFESIPGAGARATVDGRLVTVQSPAALREAGVEVPEAIGKDPEAGATIALVTVDGRYAGGVLLADRVREGAEAAVRELEALGVEPVLLSGDNESAVAAVAAKLGIRRYFAGVTPEGKADVVRKIAAEGRLVGMVGDGVNDAPSLAVADVGLAIGAGTDVAVQTADVVLLRSDPASVPAVISLARATYGKMRQNLVWATAYNAIAIPLAAGVLAPLGFVLPPAAGGALMAASTVIVAINARLLRFGAPAA